jgi:hypothetical protein
MDDPSTYGIVGRLALAGFVMIAPTLLFLGLIKGLERLRDDAFLADWAHGHGDGELETNDDVLAVLAAGLEFDRAGGSGVDCPTCGATNRSGVRYCCECLTRFPS